MEKKAAASKVTKAATATASKNNTGNIIGGSGNNFKKILFVVGTSTVSLAACTYLYRSRIIEARRIQLEGTKIGLQEELDIAQKKFNLMKEAHHEELSVMREKINVLHALWADRLKRYEDATQVSKDYLAAIPEALLVLRGLERHFSFFADQNQYVSYDHESSKLHDFGLLLSVIRENFGELNFHSAAGSETVSKALLNKKNMGGRSYSHHAITQPPNSDAEGGPIPIVDLPTVADILAFEFKDEPIIQSVAKNVRLNRELREGPLTTTEMNAVSTDVMPSNGNDNTGYIGESAPMMELSQTFELAYKQYASSFRSWQQELSRREEALQKRKVTGLAEGPTLEDSTRGIGLFRKLTQPILERLKMPLVVAKPKEPLFPDALPTNAEKKAALILRTKQDVSSAIGFVDKVHAEKLDFKSSAAVALHNHNHNSVEEKKPSSSSKKKRGVMTVRKDFTEAEQEEVLRQKEEKLTDAVAALGAWKSAATSYLLDRQAVDVLDAVFSCHEYALTHPEAQV